MESMYSPNFRALSGKLGPIALVALLLLPVVAVAITLPQVHASATISLSKSDGYVGDWVTITGQGFASNSDVTITINDKSPADTQYSSIPSTTAQVKTDPNGYFKVDIKIPALKAGSYVVKAVDGNGNAATESFTVKAKVDFKDTTFYDATGTSNAGFVGDTINITLSGFEGGETVTVKISGVTVWSGKVGNDGTKTITGITLPDIEGKIDGDTYTESPGEVVNALPKDVVATGSSSGISASTTFTILPRLYIAAYNNKNLQSFEWEKEKKASDYPYWYASINGTFSGNNNGTIAINATGLVGSKIESITLVYYILGDPTPHYAPLALHPATVDIVNGGLNKTTTVWGWVNASLKQGLSGVVDVGSPLTIRLKTDKVLYIFQNRLYYSEDNSATDIAFFLGGRSEKSLTVSNDVFFLGVAGEKAGNKVRPAIDTNGDDHLDQNLTNTVDVVADFNGFAAFNNTAKLVWVDHITYGDKTFGVNDTTGASTEYYTGLTLSVRPWIEKINTTEVHVSNALIINCSGFKANEDTTISLAGKTLNVTKVNATGQFVMVPGINASYVADVAGPEATLKIVGRDSGASVEKTITIDPTFNVPPGNLYYLPTANSTTLSGTGFPTGDYYIKFDGEFGSKLAQVHVDSSGKFSVSVSTPNKVGGTHIIDVVKTETENNSFYYGNEAHLKTVTIEPSIDVSPRKITVEGELTVYAAGLDPNTTYYIWYNPKANTTAGAQLMTTIEPAVTDSNGYLEAKFKVPSSPGDDPVSAPNTSQKIACISTSDSYNSDTVDTSTFGINPAVVTKMTVTPSAGAPGETVTVKVTGGRASLTYNVWAYRPSEYLQAGKVPQTALPVGTLSTDRNGNGETQITIPSVYHTGESIIIDLTEAGSADSEVISVGTYTLQDITAPTVTHTPVTSGTEQAPLTVTATVTDPSGVQYVILYWRMGTEGSFTSVTMEKGVDNEYSATITPPTYGTLQYYIDYADTIGNSATTDTYSVSIAGIYPVPASTPSTIDPMTRQPITAPTVGSQIGIDVPVTNTSNETKNVFVFVQIEKEGVITSFGFSTATLSPSGEFEAGIGWIPSEPGTYTIRATVVDLATGAPLSAEQTTVVTVT